MPARLLREGILHSDAVNALSPQGEVFYRRLMSVVDDFGLYDGRPAILRSALYALQLDRVREADIQRWIAESVKAGLVRLYTVDAKPYLELLKLGSPRAKEPKFPRPPSGGESGCVHLKADENNRAQPLSDAPYSGSGSDTSAKSGADKPPNPPAGGGDSVAIPAALDSPEFRAAWADWLADRRERRKPVTKRAAEQQLAKLAPLGPVEAVRWVRHAIASGWQGLYPPPPANDRPPSRAAPSKADAADDYFARMAADAYGDSP